MMEQSRSTVRRAWVAVLAVALGCIMCASGLAITPEQYQKALEENVDAYSGTRLWRAVAGQLRADEACVMDGDGTFTIVDEQGNAYLTTDSARMSISGEVHEGSIIKLNVQVTPVDSATRQFEYQAFSLSEIAFKSMLSRSAMASDMSAYLYLYDVYPYAMWANDSVFGDNSRSVTTALGGVLYAINSSSSQDAQRISLSVEVLGQAGDEDEARALDNLNANYALESISSLVYELDVCKDTCSTLLKQGDSGDAPGELMGDMRACAAEYYALGAGGYAKLNDLTNALNPCFEQMLDAISALEGEISPEMLEALDSAIDGMNAALKLMY